VNSTQSLALKLIRGCRILDQLKLLAEDSTYPELYTDIQRGFPNTQRRQHATNEVSIRQLSYLPYIGMKMLQIRAQCRSNQHDYQPILQLLNVTFENADSPENVTFNAQGTDYHMQPVDLDQSRVKVRCNCLDFYYRFAMTNFNDNSLVGRSPPVYRRVPGSNRPPANPMNVPGLCRHLIKVVQRLQQLGFVR